MSARPGGKYSGRKSYYKKKAMQFKADVLPGTKYRPLPRIMNLEIINNLLKLFICN